MCVCALRHLKRQSGGLLLLEVGESKPKFSLWVSAGWFAGPPFLEYLFGRQEYLQFTTSLFSAYSEVLTVPLYSKDFYNYRLQDIPEFQNSFSFFLLFFCFFLDWSGKLFSHLWAVPGESDTGGKAARGQGWECPAVPHFLLLTARHEWLRAGGGTDHSCLLTGILNLPRVCSCVRVCVHPARTGSLTFLSRLIHWIWWEEGAAESVMNGFELSCMYF